MKYVQFAVMAHYLLTFSASGVDLLFISTALGVSRQQKHGLAMAGHATLAKLNFHRVKVRKLSCFHYFCAPRNAWGSALLSKGKDLLVELTSL